MAALAPYCGSAMVVGLTGPPGVGKSTSTNALISELRARGRSVGVLAVDPSSPFSGGALLGDRIRMTDHASDSAVFIRSMASRGHLGGLSSTTPQAMRVLDGAGFDVVLVETVGVGQSEVEIAQMADTTAILLAPGMGDGVQAAKAGILEVGDLFIVNKADRDGATKLRRDLSAMISFSERRDGAWERRVLKTTASSGEGIVQVVDALDEHRAWLAETGELQRRRAARARVEVEALAFAELRKRWRTHETAVDLDALTAAVAAGELDPFSAADRLIGD